ncbi:MAG: hypothetical protein R6V12_00485 [Candidatus Hydrogenedentota bacterium]
MRIAAFAVIVILLQLAGTLAFGGYRPPRWVDIYLPGIVDQAPDIVFMGDSSVIAHPPKAKDRRSTSAMLDELLPDYDVAQLSLPGMPVSLEAALLSYFNKKGLRPSYVVICVHDLALRPYVAETFRSQWLEQRLFTEYDGLFLRAFFRPLVILNGIHLNAQRDDHWLETLANQAGVPVKTVRELRTRIDNGDVEGNRRRFVQLQVHARYKTPLQPDNDEIMTLKRCIALTRALGAEPILYVTPVNYELFEELNGPEVRQQMQRDSRIILKALADKTVSVTDLTLLLPRAHFYEDPMPTAHYDGAGRMQIAQRLAAEIRRLDAEREASRGAEAGRRR